MVELDKDKEYWLIIKRGSIDNQTLRTIRQTKGLILMPENLEDFQFIENSDRIKNVALGQ